MKAGFSDSINFLSNLTFRKFFNAVLVYKSFFLSRIFKVPMHWGMPVSASIEATTNCNLSCPECPSGLKRFSRETGSISLDNFQRYVDQLSKDLVYLMIYFQGEPYLNKQFFELVNYARSKRIYTATSTNGHFLDDENARKTIESGIDRIIISLDGSDEESYTSYRADGDFNKVITGIKNLVEWKKKLNSKTPYIILQCLILKSNENLIHDITHLSRQLGVDKFELKTAQFYNFQNGNSLMPLSSSYSRYNKNADGTFSLKKKLKNHCLRMWRSVVITWDGKVSPCCFDKDAQHQLGDLNKSSFKEIWNGYNYNSFRKEILTNRKGIDICCNCTE
ncbi:MAG: radical SAM/SPASM domain-containing protein [Bacteroidales bacterium]